MKRKITVTRRRSYRDDLKLMALKLAALLQAASRHSDGSG
jgi:hypothetical protein